MTPLIVIQARLNSTRLPGKILLDLAGTSVLQRVMERCKRTGFRLAVACPQPDHAPLTTTLPERYRQHLSGPSVDPTDVLARFVQCVTHRLDGPTEIVVRVTADCPLVDPGLIEAAVQAVRDGADYAGNTVERHWPRGCDVECFTTELLMDAHRSATDPYDREHVTPWMQRWATNPRALEASVRPVDAPNRWRWTLDTPKDLTFLRGLYAQYGDPSLDQAAAYSKVHTPPLD